MLADEQLFLNTSPLRTLGGESLFNAYKSCYNEISTDCLVDEVVAFCVRKEALVQEQARRPRQLLHLPVPPHLRERIRMQPSEHQRKSEVVQPCCMLTNCNAMVAIRHHRYAMCRHDHLTPWPSRWLLRTREARHACTAPHHTVHASVHIASVFQAPTSSRLPCAIIQA